MSAAVRNVLKAWLVLAGLCGVLALIGYGIGGFRVALVFVFCGLLLGIAGYLSLDRVVLGMLARARAPLRARRRTSTPSVEKLSLRAGSPSRAST